MRGRRRKATITARSSEIYCLILRLCLGGAQSKPITKFPVKAWLSSSSRRCVHMKTDMACTGENSANKALFKALDRDMNARLSTSEVCSMYPLTSPLNADR